MANKKTKARSASRRQTRSAASSALRLSIVLVVLAGIGIYIYWHYHRLPSTSQPPLASTAPVENKAVARLQPTFDFYQLLPKIEVPISQSGNQSNTPAALPETKVAAKNTEKPLENPVSGKNKHYVLQVASFKQFADADALKAKLILLGFEVKVHHYQAADQQEWYQVWVGPYASLEAAQKSQTQLAKNQVNSLLRQV